MDKPKLTREILNNSLVLEKIFQFLSFKEHLKLIDICKEFRETVVQFIWRTTCRDLIVTKRNDHYLVNLNESMDYRLEPFHCYEFLKLNQFNIQKLQLRNCTRAKLLRIVGHFENLTALEMLYCKLSDENMQEIAKNCARLKVLTLDRCLEHSYSEELVLGRDIRVQTLAQMTSLRELRVSNRYKVKMSYKTVQEIVNTLQLSKLTLSSSIVYEENSEKKAAAANCGNFLRNLEHLDLARFSDRNSWLLFVKFHLPQFENLQTLSIFIDLANCVLITDAIVKAISDSCPQLRKLCFKQCKFLLENLMLPPLLHQLSLIWCWGVTWPHLQRILGENRLKTYISINGHYDGNETNELYHSESLETLTLETSLIKDFTEILSDSKALFPNVATLNWLNSSESCHTHPQEIREELSKIFPHLQELRLEQAYLPIKEFQQMSCLQHLKLSLFDHMSWSYLLTLLQSSSLRHLTVDMPSNITTSLCPILTTKPDWQLTLIPMALTRNLKFLEIPLQLLRNALDFWLDFLDKSHDLRLKFYDCYSHELFNHNFWKNLMDNGKFPTELKTINICNNNVDCNDLRKMFNKTVDSYEFYCNSNGRYFIEI